MPNTQFPVVFNLSDLNGFNGFKLDGEAAGDKSGNSVGIAGDINGDGLGDVLVGAPGHASGTGRSYVVYGSHGSIAGGVLLLSNLNGTGGFKLDGEVLGDLSGAFVSAAGDINGDGLGDILVGAPGHASNTGRSYLLYGSREGVAGSLLSLSSLNGTNGFKLDGETSGDLSGYPVSAAGDINGDGLGDVLIGAPFRVNRTGRSYVVYGSREGTTGGLFPLSNLNGTGGFKLDGEALGDSSGDPVGAAGDVNGDGLGDVLVGAPGHVSNTGRTYVVYGSNRTVPAGLFNLSSLNGVTGFKLDGEALGDESGFSVHAAGDINGDGLGDVLVGAYGHASGTGRSYVVYGNREGVVSGLLLLSSLNGTNGFKLDGEASIDYSGFSVSAAGDVNGDSFGDVLVGAYNYANGMGRSYVVLGGSTVGAGGILALSSLDGSNGFKIDGEASLSLTGSSVAAGSDINGDGLADILIGAWNYSAATGRNYVIFGDTAPKLWTNQLTIVSGQTLVLSAQNLNATDNAPVIFNITTVSHGQFELVSAPNQAITAFNQSQVSSGQVRFVHDGSAFAPNYWVQTPNTGIALTPPAQAANITFYRKPVLLKNQLIIRQSQTVLMNSLMLNVLDDYPANQVNFTVSAVQHGQWILAPLNHSVTQFTAAQLQADQVFFVQDGTPVAPSYQVSINDPYFTLPPAAAEVTFLRNSITQFPAALELSSLNGKNGFVINGVTAGEWMSYGAVSRAGDINADGVNDLIIGAGFADPNNLTDAGKSYVVFGGSAVGSSGELVVSTLDGQNGFVLNGIEAGEGSGSCVNYVGDFNNDGVDDLIIGAAGGGIGHVYLVFGAPTVGGNGTLEFSALNGQNGFVLNGEATFDHSGRSVRGGSDINRDGVDDIVIGAYAGGQANAGKSYVLFGGSGVGSSGVIALSSLNGQNGFKLNGVAAGDFSGFSVNNLGDINNDQVDDFIIGAPNVTVAGRLGVGAAYVVFGGSSVGSNGTMALSTLNGQTGLILNGIGSGDNTAGSLGGIGDFNADGVSDLFIGAIFASPGGRNEAGSSYLVFGSSAIGSSNSTELSSLNGINGFVINGVTAGDQSGQFINFAGDINGDGIDDLIIGAYAASPEGRANAGSSYVVFGGHIPSNGVLELASLNGTNGFALYGVMAGDYSGDSVSGIGDFNGDQIDDIIIGAFGASPNNQSKAGSCYVVFGDVAPQILANQLLIHAGQTVLLSTLNLNAIDNAPIQFNITNISHGRFELVSAPGQAITAFNQSQVLSGQVQFVHDGSAVAPSYSVQTPNTGIALTPAPQAANVTFYRHPTFVNNHLLIHQGETISLIPSFLNVTEDYPPSQVNFALSNVQHGQFALLPANVSVTQFSQQQLLSGEIIFTQDAHRIATLIACSLAIKFKTVETV